ncbi:hypothetical protein [Primorskyibacter flagellatus]|uniref:hypothetical protein n=1 Tax=Primorskyibacter flagellatus TaxID=1387277 RepID=UPI003A94FD71
MPEKSPSNANQNQNQIYGGGGGASAREANLSVETNPTHREKLLAAMGADPVSGMTGHGGRRIGRQEDMTHAAAWSELGLSEAEQITVVLEVMASKRDGPPSSFKFFDRPMQRLAGTKSAAPLKPQASSGRSARPPPTQVKFDSTAFIKKHPELDK